MITGKILFAIVLINNIYQYYTALYFIKTILNHIIIINYATL